MEHGSMNETVAIAPPPPPPSKRLGGAMSLAMVVIASLVSAPGLGVLVLRGINNLELGVGLVAGLGIVLLAIILDRVTKTALSRMNAGDKQ